MEDDEHTLSAREIDAIARRIDRPIVLVGMMGVGKTSVGKRLSAVLQCVFVDADEEIETASRMTIPEMFEKFGEAHFRDGERRVIARLIEQGKGVRVIATGGGAFCNPDTRALILARGIAVWLDCDIDTLVERTQRKDNRPLLQGGNPREILTRLRDERAEHYANAPIHVVSGAGAHLRTVARVLKGIDAWL
jgi:shikimate kinase